MSEDLQSLLEKINRDGVEKARAEADRIIAEAKTKADALLNDARASARKATEDAEKSAADSADRAAETIRQAARDTVISVRDAVTKLLTGLLAKDVDDALADEKVCALLAGEVLKGLAGEAEISAAPKLAAALKAQLASRGAITVVTDETIGSGFSVKIDGGRVEHSFTGEMIAAELAKRLRPDLAKLVVGD